jgi:hypothetical protein
MNVKGHFCHDVLFLPPQEVTDFKFEQLNHGRAKRVNGSSNSRLNNGNNGVDSDSSAADDQVPENHLPPYHMNT